LVLGCVARTWLCLEAKAIIDHRGIA
jgi:hypothetical protein